jgi:hypothetical protein
MQDGFGANPFIHVVCLPPVVELTDDTIYEVLLLAGSEEDGMAFVVETVEYLLQSVDRVVLHILAQVLFKDYADLGQTHNVVGVGTSAPQNPTKRLRWPFTLSRNLEYNADANRDVAKRSGQVTTSVNTNYNSLQVGHVSRRRL